MIPQSCLRWLTGQRAFFHMTPGGFLRQPIGRPADNKVVGLFKYAKINSQSLNFARPVHKENWQQTRFISFNTKPERPQKRSSLFFLTAIVGGILGTLAIKCANEPTYRNDQRIDIPKDINEKELLQLIKAMVRNRDKEAIIELINKLKEPKDFFTNLNFWHLWEIDIRDELIRCRDFELIREIFPLFCKQTLSYIETFYKPIKRGDLELVKAMCEGGMQTAQTKMNDVLLYSIYERKMEIARYFLEHGEHHINSPYPFDIYDVERKVVSPNTYAFDCITPAYLAVVMNDAKLLKELIDLGADCSAPNTRPLGANKYRMSDHDSDNALIYSIEKGYDACFDVIMNNKDVDLNYRGHGGKTALLIAALKGNSRMAQTLISRKVNVNIRDAFDHTALMYSVSNGDISTIKALLDAEADPRCICDIKMNLWHYANSDAVYQLLVECGIQDMIDEENEFGRSPLYQAVADCNPNAVYSLLKYGADINKTIMILKSGPYKFNLKEEINIHEFAQVTLEEIQNYLTKYPEYKNNLESKISSLKEIISILLNPPEKLAIDAKLAPIISGNDHDKIIPKLNKVKLEFGSQQEIENKIHHFAPHCDGDFVRKFSKETAGRTFDPKTFISHLYLAIIDYEEFENFPNSAIVMIHMLVPQMLCAFSDDPDMQGHLKALWKQLHENPELFYT